MVMHQPTPLQEPFPLHPCPYALGQWLAVQLKKPVHLAWTRNRSTMVSFREGARQFEVRLHRMFLEAPEIVWLALVHYFASGERVGHKDAGRVIDLYIEANKADYHRPPTRLTTRGLCHDLRPLFDGLNRQFFHEACTAAITWGRRTKARRSRRSIQLGAYVPQDHLIRIHPCLDQAAVPEFYVTTVVFHEMLHEVLGVQGHGPGSVHSPEFVALEESHPDFERAKAWERQNLSRLLRH